jgi:hypothetical protein
MDTAYAQELIISTSADELGGIFFGEGVLQVVVTDETADDDDTIEDITVEIEADPDTGSSSSTSVLVPETSQSSGRFEFFLAHDDAAAVGPEDLDPINSQGVEGDGTCASDCAPFVTFGPAGDIPADADLFEDTNFQITAGDIQITTSYEEAHGILGLDRSSYGSTSFVYVFVTDQDANLNPFVRDEFVVDPSSPPNQDLLFLDGGTLDAVVTFRETGDNTAKFEGKYRLGTSITVESESLVLTLFEKANYLATLAAAENDSDLTDEVSFTVGDSDPTVDVGGSIVTWDPKLTSDRISYSLGERVQLTINDPDANANPNVVESIQLLVAFKGDQGVISAPETGANTGIFAATFTIGGDTDVAVTQGSVLTVTYTDKRPADYSEKLGSGENPEKDFSIEIPIDSGNLIDTTTVTAPFVRNIGGASTPLTFGTELVLSASVANNRGDVQPFVAILEVRNAEGVTVFLSSEHGTLSSNGSSGIEIVWKPAAQGDYTIRTFVISGFDEGEVLSTIAVSEASIV